MENNSVLGMENLGFFIDYAKIEGNKKRTLKLFSLILVMGN
jgi:hypothetical protein